MANPGIHQLVIKLVLRLPAENPYPATDGGCLVHVPGVWDRRDGAAREPQIRGVGPGTAGQALLPPLLSIECSCVRLVIGRVMRFTLGLSECREIGGGPFLGTVLSAEEALCTLVGIGDQNAASCKMEWCFLQLL